MNKQARYLLTMSPARPSAGGGLPPLLAPRFDSFTAAEGFSTGALNGQKDYAVHMDSGGSGTVNALQVNATTGVVSGTSGNTGAHGARGSTGEGWARWTFNGSGDFLEAHKDMGAGSFTGLRFGPTTDFFIQIRKVANGVDGSFTNMTAFQHRPGDVYEMLTDGDNKLFMYWNGRRITSSFLPDAGYDLTANSLSATGAHGWKGHMSASAAPDFEVGDTATRAMLRLYQPTRIAQREANGDLVMQFEGEATKRDPTALKYTIQTSAGVDVSGQVGQDVQSLSAASGAFSGQTSAFTPVLGTAYVLTVYREDAVDDASDPAIIRAHGPYVYPGEVDGCTGQSLATQSYSGGATTTTWTAPSRFFLFNADSTKVDSTQDITRFSTNDRPLTAFAATIAAAYGLSEVGLIKGGLGATTIAARGVGTATHNAYRNGFRMAGKRLRFCHHIDGESDSNNGDAYRATFEAIYDDLDTLNGRALDVLISPYGATSHADASAENIRRAQYRLANDHPGRFHVSSNKHDLQHFTAGSVWDSLHLDNESYGIMWRRQAIMRAYLDGAVAYHLLGPSIASVAKIDAETIDVTFDLNTMDSMTHMNTGYASDFRGGMRFGTGYSGGNVTGQVAPTATSVGSPSGGQVVVRFTFPASSFTGDCYVGGPWGANPFNPTNDNDTNLLFRTRASMLAGVKSGEANVGIQPYYDFATGNDYLIAS